MDFKTQPKYLGANLLTAVTESTLTLTDNTTADVSTTKHGLVPKLPNDSSKYLNGLGVWAVPPGSDGRGGSGTGYSVTIGNDTDSTLEVTHGLGSMDVTVECYFIDEGPTYKKIYVDYSATTINHVQLYFDSAPATGSIRVIVSSPHSIPVIATEHYEISYSKFGPITAYTGSMKRFVLRDGTITVGTANLGVAGNGTSVFEIKKGATTIGTATFATGVLACNVVVTNPALVAGDLLAVNCTTAPTTNPKHLNITLLVTT